MGIINGIETQNIELKYTTYSVAQKHRLSLGPMPECDTVVDYGGGTVHEGNIADECMAWCGRGIRGPKEHEQF